MSPFAVSRYAVALLASICIWQSAPARADLVIRNVHVIDVAGGGTMPARRLVIRAGRIAAITEERGPVGDAALDIDGGGAFVIPGLWDMHAHLLEYPGLSIETSPHATLPLFIANGVLGVRDMGTHDFSVLKRLRDEIDAGARLGPRLRIGGRPLDGLPPTDWIKRPIGSEVDARAAVAALKADGADFVKVYDRLSRPVYLAAADEAKRQGLRLVGHLPLAVSVSEALAAGQRSVEHMGLGKLRTRGYGYLPDGAVPPSDATPAATLRLFRALRDAFAGRADAAVWDATTYSQIASPAGAARLAAVRADLGDLEAVAVLRRTPRAAGTDVAVLGRHARGERTYRVHDDASGRFVWLADEPDVERPEAVRALAAEIRAAGAWITPTLTPLRALAFRRELTASPDPRLDYVTTEVRRAIGPGADSRLADWTDEDWAAGRRMYARDAHMVRALRRHGVRLLAGTDGITDYCLPGFGVHNELALMVAAGLSPLEALQTATLEPAAFFEELGDAGTIEVGKAADLVLLARDPLIDIRNVSAIRAVVRAGRLLDRAALDSLLTRVRAIVQGR